MDIKFSRHARRRMSLYGISEQVIASILKEAEPELKEIVRDAEGFQYPIKVVYDHQEEYISVITAYPLRKARE